MDNYTITFDSIRPGNLASELSKKMKPTPREDGKEIDISDFFDPFIHDGVVTVTSSRTGEHRTFKVETVRSGDLAGKRILSIGNHEKGFFGFAFVDSFNLSIKVWWRKDTEFYRKSAKMFENLRSHVASGEISIQASGKCRRCGRPLTNPESIRTGLGPYCREQV